MDQFSTAASEERCTAGSLVANVPFFGDASVDDQIWVTGAAITALTLPGAMFGNGTVTYTLTPALPTGLSFANTTRTISGTPTATAAAATYTLTATDTDSDTATLTFRIETAANATPAFATGATIADQSWVTHNAITSLTLPGGHRRQWRADLYTDPGPAGRSEPGRRHPHHNRHPHRNSGADHPYLDSGGCRQQHRKRRYSQPDL